MFKILLSAGLLTIRLPFLIIIIIFGLITITFYPKDIKLFKKSHFSIMMIWMKCLSIVLGLKTKIIGQVDATADLFVSNHVTYLDIIILNKLLPVNFIAKDEISKWPVIGSLASKTGTLFIKRGDNIASTKMIGEMQSRFELKNKIIFYLLNFFIPFIERYTFNKANVINIVSPGFRDYFKNNNYGEKAEFQTYTNGIDDLFLNNTEVNVKRINKPKRQIIYAGNIGLSQSLDKTLPYVAKKLQETHEFHIYGDGAGKHNLLSKIKTNDSQNIFLHEPINREKLVDIYKKSDILYFQLADLDAFLRVIPSKLFEYSVYGKPIIAVVEGYSKSFVLSKLDGCYVAEPNNIESIVDTINKINPDQLFERKDFIKRYSRRNINDKMSSSI